MKSYLFPIKVRLVAYRRYPERLRCGPEGHGAVEAEGRVRFTDRPGRRRELKLVVRSAEPVSRRAMLELMMGHVVSRVASAQRKAPGKKLTYILDAVTREAERRGTEAQP